MSLTTMLRLRIDVVEWTRCRSIEGIEISKVSNSGRSIQQISKYRDTTRYQYRTFASMAILRYIEYRTSTNIYIYICVCVITIVKNITRSALNYIFHNKTIFTFCLLTKSVIKTW